ncbi:MAG: hypothetical protein KME28_22825 [Pelatocladus maniniholoensis HA4357-MV3]|jgi:hypothetical protein|uniref:Uncharacterized protein n=1 Tax=Pelatocladus maniniholoensis HA4357-MV3 TaxID=1117104 RepID=A0A9E3HBL6_9NOST|nr:hypothetical protein [Pelatocladus maniniholoensis HA4357-MV3]BAZ70731.1 hypothetical protein NIES4106_55280 [Fischerella sp. NIES-4106]
MFHRKQGQISSKSNKVLQKQQQKTTKIADEAHSIVQKVKADPSSLSADQMLTLQETIGNRAANRLLAGRNAAPVQAKLTIGQPGDNYEPEAKEEDAMGQQAFKSSVSDRSKEIIQRQAIKLEGEELSDPMKERLNTAFDQFNAKVLSTSFLSQGQTNQVVIWGIKSTNDFKDYGSTTFYIGNSNQGYQAQDYGQFTEIWQWALNNPIPKDISVRIVIAVNLSINRTTQQLFATLLHEWHVHAVKWKGLIEYIREDKGNFAAPWIQGQGYERRGKGEHKAYANMSDQDIESMVDELNLEEKDKKTVIQLLKRDRDRYDKNTGEI